MTKQNIQTFDLWLIALIRRHYILLARIALLIVFFWFGALKLFGLSPASPLALALTERTIGGSYFEPSFMILSVIECLIGILFLVPKATRIVIPMLLIHIVIVSSPLVLVPDLVWSGLFVPSLEGQYIIKNVVLVALAIAIAAQLRPLGTKK